MLRPEPVGEAEVRYATPAEEFALSVLGPSGEASWTSPEDRSVEVLLCASGWIELVDGQGRRLLLDRGSSAVVPSAAGRYRAEGAGIAYRASVGVDCA